MFPAAEGKLDFGSGNKFSMENLTAGAVSVFWFKFLDNDIANNSLHINIKGIMPGTGMMPSAEHGTK